MGYGGGVMVQVSVTLGIQETLVTSHYNQVLHLLWVIHLGLTINVSRFIENSHGLTTGNRDVKNNSDRCMR